jgi:hypothetical protein
MTPISFSYGNAGYSIPPTRFVTSWVRPRRVQTDQLERLHGDHKNPRHIAGVDRRLRQAHGGAKTEGGADGGAGI